MDDSLAYPIDIVNGNAMEYYNQSTSSGYLAEIVHESAGGLFATYGREFVGPATARHVSIV